MNSDLLRKPALKLSQRSLSLQRVLIMGILNATPDSFYDKGKYGRLDLALDRAHQLVDEGADVIDVGGEKAGPGTPVSVEEEIERVIPLISGIRRQMDVPISIDTIKPKVALAALDAGAEIVSSISGLQDRDMRRVLADSGAGTVIMHIQGMPRVANPTPQYSNVVEEVSDFLQRRAHECIDEGINPDSIVIDPGPGFGKTSAHDIAVVKNLSRFTVMPYPLLLAASRKKFIGEILGSGVEDRLEGSLAVLAWGVLQGVKIVRVHDVLASTRVVRMTEAVLNPDLVETGTP